MTESDHDRLYARACEVTPGGVHSPVRALRSIGTTPVFTAAARGAMLITADGRQLTDFCMAFGPMILGHANPQVKQAVAAALERGWSYGTAEAISLQLAELVTDRLPWVEQLRFVNSGTEAVMTALRIARAATGRDKILKFAGCYHGHVDAMLIRAGSGLAGEAVPDSAGVTPGVSKDTLIAALDDERLLEQIFSDHGDQIAAAIIEPLPANFGLLPQRPAFLARLAELCRQYGALLIHDEVISGFRLAFGGYAEHAGVQADLVTYGKIIGGGFPVGAVAGRRDLMEQLAPAGPVYQAGTLSANPVAMTAGLATLQQLADGQAYTQLEELGAYLQLRLEAIAGLRVQRVGSLFWFAPGAGADQPIRTPAAIPEQSVERYAGCFQALLAHGIYLPPSAYEIAFLSMAHEPAHIDRLADRLADHLADHMA